MRDSFFARDELRNGSTNEVSVGAAVLNYFREVSQVD